MKELYNLGIDENDIKNMVEICPDIKDLDYKDILNNIDILKSIDCNERHIRNILISNPYFLIRSSDDILNLIKIFIKLEFDNLNLLFDSNPYLLNKDAYEIEEYIEKEISKGINLEEVKDKLEQNPYIIDNEGE